MVGLIGGLLFILGLLGLVTAGVSHDVLAWICLIAGIILIFLAVAPIAQRYRR